MSPIKLYTNFLDWMSNMFYNQVVSQIYSEKFVHRILIIHCKHFYERNLFIYTAK